MTDTSEKIGELLRSAGDHTFPVVRGITDDQLTAPTPFVGVRLPSGRGCE